MAKRTLVIALFGLVLAVTFFALSEPVAHANVLCVNPKGTGGCYPSIQAAIDAASSGDTINVAAGTYTGTIGSDPFPEIRIQTDGIAIRGAGPNTVISAALLNGSQNVIISNLKIEVPSGFWGIGNGVTGINLKLEDITIFGNGWGIYANSGTLGASNLSVYSSDGLVCNMGATVAITNSVLTTLSRNHPTTCRTVTLTNDTFTGVVSPTGSVVTATNTIFAGGCAAPPGNQYINSLGYNIDGGNNCTLGAVGDMTGTNPLLTLPVLINGAFVNALMPNSPAIDKGNDATCPPTDRTGFLRPYGARCDIGAYEWRPMNFSFSFLPFIAK